MPIRTVCPRCTRGINAPDEFSGKIVKCPECVGRVAIPRCSAESQEVANDPMAAVVNRNRPLVTLPKSLLPSAAPANRSQAPARRSSRPAKRSSAAAHPAARPAIAPRAKVVVIRRPFPANVGAICVVALALGFIAGREYFRWELRKAVPGRSPLAAESTAGPTSRAMLLSDPGQPVAEPTPSRADPFGIVSIKAKITESNPDWSKFAWILRIQNRGAKPICFTAKISFLDKAGFIVDEQRIRDLTAPPGESVHRGAKCIAAQSADAVKIAAVETKSIPLAARPN